MVIKKHRTFPGTLLILASVVYTLLFLRDIAFAQVSMNMESTASIATTASVDKREVTIGDKVKFRICVRYKDGITIVFPEFTRQLGVFTVKEMGDIEGPKAERNGCYTVERTYVLNSYEIGHQTIPSVKIKYAGNEGDGEVVTNEVTVDIKGVLKEGEVSGDIKDILPPVDIPTSFGRLILWISAGLGGILLSGVVYLVIRKRKGSQKRQEEEFTRRLPHEVAYELLERLSQEDLITQGLIKEYYYRITDILRHYIEDRFGLLAPERTTEEFLIEMAHTNKLENGHKLLIREFLERCDMVKYAKYGPARTEIQEAYDAAKRLIDETKERLEEKEVVAK